MIGEGRRSCGWAREGKGDGRGSSIRGRRGLLTGMSANNRSAMGASFATPQLLSAGVCCARPWCTSPSGEIGCALCEFSTVYYRILSVVGSGGHFR